MNFNFNLRQAEIYRAVLWERNPVFRFAGWLKKIFLFAFIILLAFFLYGFFPGNFAIPELSLVFGLLIISLVLFVFFWELKLFLDFKLKRPELPLAIAKALDNLDKVNLAEFLDFEAAKAVVAAIKYARSENLGEIDSSLLFYSVLKENHNEINFIFSRALLDLQKIRNTLKDHLKALPKVSKFRENYPDDFRNVLRASFKIAAGKLKTRVEITDLLAALAQENLIFKKILIDADLKTQDIENIIRWLEYLVQRAENRKKFWTYKNLAKRGTMGSAWAAGYTITLDQFSIDWTQAITNRGFEEIIGHKDAISQTERILGRTQINNALIVGEPGSGRGSIVEALAQKCLFGESLPTLNYKRVVELDVSSLLAKIDNPEEVEMVLDKVFREADFAGNIILVINEFHNFIGQLIRPGVVDISGVLAPYLKSPTFQVVAVTTYDGLHRNIEQNSSLLSLFEKVEVAEISNQDTLILLENMALFLEQKFGKFISYPALRDIVFYSEKYLPDVSFPKKAVDLLDEIMVYVSELSEEKVLLPKHVAKVISEKTQIPVGDLGAGEKQILLNMEKLLHQRIVGQEEAVSEVSTAMRRARAEITIRKGPMGAFLFLGPTGVGKTETSKALAEIYFGAEDKMIRLDMSEFQNLSDISRLIGGDQEEGMLTTKVRENPFSLILLDEFEKAHPNVLNLFLQVFDEGHVTDGLGRKVNFKNCLIIATSNAGYQVILEALKKGKEMGEIKNQLLDFLFKEGVFRPELINRFDAVVVFKSLTKENLLLIAELLLKKLKNNLTDKGIDFEISEPLKEKVAELGYNPVFGARQMRRVIQDKIENVLAVQILSGEIKKGNRITINPEGFKVEFRNG